MENLAGVYRKMDKTRINAIDIAKGIGIILVIVGHALPSASMVRVFVYTFHMPLFFILAGMVMKSPERNRNMFEDFGAERKLISAYCRYSVLFVVFDAVVRLFVLREIGFGEFLWDVYQTMVFYGINVLWFLPTLVLAKVLVKRICRLLASKVWWLVTGIALYAVCSMISGHIQWLDMGKYRLVYYPLVAVLRGTSMTVYILLGYIVKRIVREYIIRSKLWITTCVAAFTVSLLLLIYRFVGDVDIHIMKMGNWSIAFACAMLGFLAVLSVSVLIDKVGGIRESLRYIGINSLFIMATHDYFKIRVLINWLLLKLGLLECQYTVLLQIVLLIAVECMLCKLCAPYVKRAINRMNRKDKSYEDNRWHV